MRRDEKRAVVERLVEQIKRLTKPRQSVEDSIAYSGLNLVLCNKLNCSIGEVSHGEKKTRRMSLAKAPRRKALLSQC